MKLTSLIPFILLLLCFTVSCKYYEFQNKFDAAKDSFDIYYIKAIPYTSDFSDTGTIKFWFYKNKMDSFLRVMNDIHKEIK